MSSQKTLPHLLRESCLRKSKKKVVGHIHYGRVKYLSGEEYLEQVKRVTLGLLSINVRKDTRIAIFSQTNIKWNICDLAILSTGAITIPIYPNLSVHETQYIIDHSESTFIIIDNLHRFKKIVEIQNQCPNLKTIISLTKIDEEETDCLNSNIDLIHYDQLKSLSNKNTSSFRETISNIKKENIASIIYTSGTTGLPKGSVLTHESMISMLENIKYFMQEKISSADRTMTFLPLSHVLGRCDSFLNLILDSQVVYAESIENFLDNIKIIKPTFFIGVPRVFEKIYEEIVLSVKKKGILTQKIFNFANEASRKYYRKIDRDLSPTTSEITKKNIAYTIFFKKVFEELGGEIRFLVSGGAPLRKEIIYFLRNSNLPILEGYGLTETIGPCTLNPISKQIPGTVGIPIGDVQLKFTSNNEILIKTKSLMDRYFKDSQNTKNSFTKDGWLKTGDIGELTQEGYLQITGRQKDLIITSGGKNIAPQKIENLLKTIPVIDYIMIIGEARKYLSAVISLKKDVIPSILKELEIPLNTELEELVKMGEVHNYLKNKIEILNKKLSSFESIRKIYISPLEFSVENGLLTPSFKLKKNFIYNKFEREIDAMYKNNEF